MELFVFPANLYTCLSIHNPSCMDSDVIEKYRKAGKIAANAREYGISLVKEGALAFDVAEAIEDFIKEKGAEPAFPANLSVNQEAAHYTPVYGDKRRFKRGDVIKVDVGAHVDGYIGDTSRTVEVGSSSYSRLIRAAEEGLNTAIDVIKVGVSLNDIGMSVEAVIKGMGYRPVENLTGHSLKQYELHSGISIPSVSGLENGKIWDEIAVAVEPFATDGAGYVVSGGNPGIYRIYDTHMEISDIKLREFYSWLVERFGSLPFAERWCHEFDKNAGKLLKKLVRIGGVHAYDVLVEAKKGIVSQREHTMLVLKDRVEITTEAENGL